MAKSGKDQREITVEVDLGPADETVEVPPIEAHAFDSNGRYVAGAEVSDGRARIRLHEGLTASDVRVYVGPPSTSDGPPTREALRTAGAVKTRLVGSIHQVAIDPAIWRSWLLCSCVVRGRVAKRVVRPDGTVVEVPVCHTRVHIFEVDPWWLILRRLPDELLYRVRDDLLERRLPPIPPDPLHALADMLAAPTIDVEALSLVREPDELRRLLADWRLPLRWWWCWWPWLDRFFGYSTREITTVDTDDDGYFTTTIRYACAGDHPDLYFQVEQERAGVWNWVYRPPIRCTTWWDYPCGTFVTLEVTDPSARTCEEGDPIAPPAGLGTTWVMPFAIGGLKVRGYGGVDVQGDAAWVRTDGVQEDGLPATDPWHGVPFGQSLSIRLAYEVDLPTPAITYYRLSWRERGTTTWQPLHTNVVRYYEKHIPGHLFPSFPAALMGPFTVGGQDRLYRFRPHAAPVPDPMDPPGTTTNWPAESFFGDIFHGFLDTVGEISTPSGATGSFGNYELGLELFSDAGAVVHFGPATVAALFPSSVDPDLTIHARLAAGLDFDGDHCVFPLVIDNRVCEAAISAPTTGGAVADNCGMLHHGAGNPVGMGFHAWRPGGYATFSFGVSRGRDPATGNGYPTKASTSARVTDTSAASGDATAPWVGTGTGDFADSFPPADLLDTCKQAAFAVDLWVAAKVTNGWGRFTTYDRGAITAFALVK